MLAKPIPTPSKGALRVLRQIAYASTFGGTALMMEDRRRRIRVAREVQNNAKKLRSCRQYHGAAAIAQLDSEASSESEELDDGHPNYQGWHRHAPFLPSEVQKAYESVERSRLRSPGGPSTSSSSPTTTRNTAFQARQDQGTTEQIVSPVEIGDQKGHSILGEHPKKRDAPPPNDLASQGIIEPSIPSPCDSTARSITSFLKKKNLSAAGKAYFGYFEADHAGRDVNRNFVKAALRLSFASEKAGNTWMVQRIHDQLPGSELPSPRRKIEELLAASKVQEAATLFLRVFEKKQCIHEKTAILASRICLAALPLKLYKEIDAIFWRIRSTGDMHPDCWETLLKALAERREHGQLGVVYHLLKDQYPLSQTSYELVVRAMAALSRLDDAREVLERSFQLNGQAAKHGYVIVLRDTWQTTRNYERVRDIFEGMRSWSSESGHTASSFNAIISICVEAGRESEAREYRREMVKDQGLQANLETEGQFILAEASKGDWEVVGIMLDHIKDKYSDGMTSGDAKAFLLTINRLLKEHLNHYLAHETEAFFWKLVNKHGMVPNKATSEIIVTGYVRSGDLDLVFKWIQSVQKYGLAMDSFMSSAMFKHYWRTNRVSHKRLWYMYSNLKSLDKDLVSEQFLNVMRDAISYDIRKRRPQARKSHVMAGRLVSLGRERVNSDIYDRKSNQRQMLLAMSLNNPIKAIQIYESSKARGLPLDWKDLEIAVECSIRAHRGSFDPAVKLLQSAQEAGMNIQGALTPILIHGTYRRQQTGEELARTAMEFYGMLEKNNIRVRHHVAVATANQMVNQGSPRAAVNLLSNVSRLPLTEKKPLDIVGMTIFLRAYGALKDLVGVEWVVKTVFQKNLRVDHLFLKALRNVKKPIQVMKQTSIEGSDVFSNCMRLLGLLDVWCVEVRQKMADSDDEAKRQGRALVQVVKRLHVQKSLTQPRTELHLEGPGLIAKVRRVSINPSIRSSPASQLT